MINHLNLANNSSLIMLISLLWLTFFTGCYQSVELLNPFKFIKEELVRHRLDVAVNYGIKEYSELPLKLHVSNQEGLKEKDKIQKLPGEPDQGVEFDHYSGYVPVDPDAGRALFYYFVESPINSSYKPLVLWLNGGPGCSSLGSGAMMELGPFRVNQDGQTLTLNQHAWTNVANIIFLESPAGVGFSYSNTTSDYKLSGDKRTAEDSYTFLVNWFERFPEYKLRDFFIAGESYAGHYVPQLAQLILHNNKHTNYTNINLKGITLGNALLDLETTLRGAVDYYWTHALMSDQMYFEFLSTCKFTSLNDTDVCLELVNKATDAAGTIYPYDIYAPLCNSSVSSSSAFLFDPCTENYVRSYLNIPQVQRALHVNITDIPYPWQSCSGRINRLWKDRAVTVLPILQELMSMGIRVWIYSGDTDGALPVTCTRYAITKLESPILTTWYPWYIQGEVGGYAVGYQNLTFMTIRGAGHFVPSYQPVRALALFLSFIEGKLPPAVA